jgi:hypothetical protein
VLNSACVLLVDDTSSHQNGKKKYTISAAMKRRTPAREITVSSCGE